MPLGVNATLGTTATLTAVNNNGLNDIIDVSGNGLADRIWFTAVGSGFAGDETIEGFGKNDTILNHKKIFDGNGDGIVDFGPNGILDIDRVSSKNAGADQITVNGLASGKLRYLGSKGGDSNLADGVHVYADASVRLAGFIEGTVGNDSFDASTGDRTYFYDTALGLNLGGDTITGFGSGDRIVTTTKIYNGPDAGVAITFGANGVLDLPDQEDATTGDAGVLGGGQIDFVGGPTELYLINTATVDGVNYYYYGVDAPA
jgi:hypothetical protein